MIIFSGTVPQAGIELTARSQWFHVVVPPGEQAPIRASVTREGLAAGGDTIWPGSSLDVFTETLWLQAPSHVGRVSAFVEGRTRQTYGTMDPFGVLRGLAAAKADSFPLTPGEWRVCFSNISGLVGYLLLAHGGEIWVGTHNNRDLPPWVPNQTMGEGFPLTPGTIVPMPGNPAGLAAYASRPGCTLYVIKFERDWSFGEII